MVCCDVTATFRAGASPILAVCGRRLLPHRCQTGGEGRGQAECSPNGTIVLLNLTVYDYFLFVLYITSAATENVAREGKLRISKIWGGGKGVYNVLIFQKSRGGKSSPRGKSSP